MTVGKVIKNLVCILWLVVVTPIFSVFPLMIVLGQRPPLFFLERAILRGFWTLFFADTAPDFEDVGPPLSETGWWLMIAITLALAIVAAWYLLHSIKNRRANIQ